MKVRLKSKLGDFWLSNYYSFTTSILLLLGFDVSYSFGNVGRRAMKMRKGGTCTGNGGNGAGKVIPGALKDNGMAAKGKKITSSDDNGSGGQLRRCFVEFIIKPVITYSS